MRIYGLVIAAGLLVGCAATQEGPLVPLVDARPVVIDAKPEPGEIDAPVVPDAPIPDAQIFDAPIIDARIPDALVDARVDALVDAVPPDACTNNFEFCNGKDDNCNGATDETFTDLGMPCSVGMGACVRDGVKVCAANGLNTVCSATPGMPGSELCGNGIDDNCNGKVDEGYEVFGTECATGVGACLRTGAWLCTADRLSVFCSAHPAEPAPKELCGNVIDDNCDGRTDEGFEQLGMPCTVGEGACKATGVYQCSGDRTALVCSATPLPPGVELCGDGIDNDCDGDIDEGFDNLGDACTVGTGQCQGAGIYVCRDDKMGTVCNGVLGQPSPEICDGVDNDCNPATADGSGDPRLFQPCDGPDNDTCKEGFYLACGSNGSLVCSDTTTNDTTNDPNNCGLCGRQCRNAHGTVGCSGSQCSPTCDTGWQHCSSDPLSGCDTARIPGNSCPGAYIGAVSGDENADVAPGNTEHWQEGYTSAWYFAYIDETNHNLFNDYDISATVDLDSPADADFDLFVYCYNCGGTLIGSSRHGAGQRDSVSMRRGDSFGEDDYNIVIEVRYYSSQNNPSSCGNWKLRVRGHTGGAVPVCP